MIMALQKHWQCLILLSILLLHTAASEDAVTGDVRLVQTSISGMYEVQVYFGDGVNPPSWVGVCHEYSYHVHDVVCQQLGYEPVQDSPSFTTVQPTTQIKLYNVDCREMSDANHILRCKYNVSQSGSDCPNTATPALAIKCDFSTPLSKYDGQVILCPPQFDNVGGTIYKRSASFGVIGVRLHNKLMAISQPVAGSGKESQPLGGSEADAICRELGYTGVIPGSIATKTAYENMNVSPPYKFNHCYSAENTVETFPFGYIHNASWLSTDKVLKCTNLRDSQKCFGCCYDYPKDQCDDVGCTRNNYDVVIRCGFEPGKHEKVVGTAGSNVTCAFNEERKISQCISVCADTDPKLHNVKRDYGWSIGVFVVSTVVLGGSWIVFLVYLKWKRTDYETLAGEQTERQGEQQQRQENTDDQ